MGSGAPAADSSSPSAKRTLVEITPVGTAGELRLRLVLSDGSCFFVPEQSLRALGLAGASPPIPLDEDAWLALAAEAEALLTREKAMDLLDRAPHSEASLRRKLQSRHFAPGAIDRAVRWLAERGLLDDRRFAEAWVAARLERHPEGREALVAGLRRRGVERNAAEQVVSRLMDPEAEKDAAGRLLAKLRRQGLHDPQVLSRRMASRGFRRPLVRCLLEGGQ